MSELTHSLKGFFHDVLIGADGTIYDFGRSSNTIVNTCRILLAGFMHNDSSSGIQHLAVGQGSPTWDAVGAPPTDPAVTTGLVNPFATVIDVADLQIEYLNAADQVVPDPTSRLQITATLDPGFPTPLPGQSTYPLREFGLFGEFDGSPFMINSIRHSVIHKDAAATLIRVVRLYF